MFLKTLKIMG